MSQRDVLHFIKTCEAQQVGWTLQHGAQTNTYHADVSGPSLADCFMSGPRPTLAEAVKATSAYLTMPRADRERAVLLAYKQKKSWISMDNALKWEFIEAARP